MNFPTSYDTEVANYALANELVVLTLNGGVDDTTTTMTFNETTEVAALNTPTFLTFQEEDTASQFEIVQVTGTATGGVCTVVREVLSSTAMSHPNGAQAVQDPVSAHLSTIRTFLLGIEKYHGLVGLESALPGSCSVGEVYIATDTEKVFQAVDTDTWREINELDHNTLGGMGDDDHTQYHTDSRKLTWHTGLSGVHITKADHNHDGTSDDGQPVARIQHGLLSARPATPSYDGQLYYATDYADLYIGNSSTWIKYSVMPVDTVIIFPGTCPQGWTELTAFQGKFLRGAPTGVYTGLSGYDGGALVHSHSLQEIINHVHSINSVTGQICISGGSHSHSMEKKGGGGTKDLPYDFGCSGSWTYWNNHSAHSHTVTFPEHNTNSSGLNPADTEDGSSLPPYVNYVFCQKD